MTDISGSTKLHRNVKAAGWVSLFTDFSSEMIYPLLPVFLKSVVGTGTVFIGLIEGAAETTASLLKLASGYISDRMQKRKPLMFGGYCISSLSRPLVALATSGWHVLAIRMADRIGKGIRTSPRDALIADVTPQESRGMAFGFQRAMDNAGAFIGPLVATAILWWLQHRIHLNEAVALRWLFAIAAIPGLLVPLIIWRFISEPPIASPKEQTEQKKRTESFPRSFKFYLVVIVLFTLGNSSDAFLVLRANDAGVPSWQIPLLWAAFHLCKTLSSTPGGKLSDRLGRKPMLVIGWSIYSLSYVLFGFASTPIQIWVLFAFYALYYGCVEGAERALIADLVPKEMRATAYGWFHAAIGLIALPSSVLFGALWQWSGKPFVPFITGAFFAGLAAVLLSRVKTKL